MTEETSGHDVSRTEFSTKLQEETRGSRSALGAVRTGRQQGVKVRPPPILCCKRGACRASRRTATPGCLSRARGDVDKISKIDLLIGGAKVWEETAAPGSWGERRQHGMLTWRS